jgi:hypothetical protein
MATHLVFVPPLEWVFAGHFSQLLRVTLWLHNCCSGVAELLSARPMCWWSQMMWEWFDVSALTTVVTWMYLQDTHVVVSRTEKGGGGSPSSDVQCAHAINLPTVAPAGLEVGPHGQLGVAKHGHWGQLEFSTSARSVERGEVVLLGE